MQLCVRRPTGITSKEGLHEATLDIIHMSQMIEEAEAVGATGPLLSLVTSATLVIRMWLFGDKTDNRGDLISGRVVGVGEAVTVQLGGVLMEEYFARKNLDPSRVCKSRLAVIPLKYVAPVTCKN